MAAYLAERGHRRVVVMGEGTPGDAEYRAFFTAQAALYGLEIADSYYFSAKPADGEVDQVLIRFRDVDPDALVYCGFGFHSRLLNPALARIGWQPEKIMNAAIMWALASPEWCAALEGWVGIEQTNGDDDHVKKNPNWESMLDRYQSRFGERPDGTMTALLYDQGRAAVEAVVNATVLDGPGLAIGLEQIKTMPATLGGPGTYIGFGPEDHRGYRGDFMFMKQLRLGKFHFVSYHRPQWPSNHRSTDPGGGTAGAGEQTGTAKSRVSLVVNPEGNGVVSCSCVFPPSTNLVAYAQAAERLGYRRIWLYDSPALYGDVWIALARIAAATEKIGLGVGVAVASLRHPMVTASAIATIEELAPGRLVTALGTGYTGRESMGQRPMRWQDLATYIDQVRGLLLGDEVIIDGAPAKMLHGADYAPRRPIHSPVWAAPSGPKGFATARKLGVPGVITPMPPTEDIDAFDDVALLTFGTVLRPGEDADSVRVRQALGPMIATSFHGLIHADPDFVDGLPGGRAWRLALERKWPADRRHFAHTGHLCEVTELDRPLVEAAGAEILTIGWTGSAAAIREHRELAASQGITEVTYAPMGPDIPSELRDFATIE